MRRALVMLRAQHFHLLLTGDETSGQQDVELLREVRRYAAPFAADYFDQ